MPDMGEVKAKVTIEYDGGGLDKAKEDLKSLAEIASGELTDGTNSANDALSGLDEQMGKSAESTRALTSSVGAMEKPLQAGEGAITSVTDALGEHQAAIEDTGSAYEALQKPIEATTMLMEDASPSMIAMAQHAESLQENLGNVSDGFSSMGQSVAQAAQVIPTFSDHMQNLSEEFDPKAFGLDTFAQNWDVFQAAMSDPAPLDRIMQHIEDTGQTVSDFGASIGSDNHAMLLSMDAVSTGTEESMGTISKSVQSTGQSFVESMGQTEDFTQQYSSMGETVASVNKGMGEGSAVTGAYAKSFDSLDESVVSANKSINAFGGVGNAQYGPAELAPPESIGFGEAVGGVFGGLMDTMNQIAMPLMAVQQIGMAVQTVSKGIYDMAALAEGPAAHSVGTFTGSVDALGQTVQQSGEQFSESFGKGIMPTLDAINYQMNQGLGTGGLGLLGKDIGTNLSSLYNLVQFGTGLNPVGGFQGLVNTGASLLGLSEPFQGPAASSQQSSQQLAIQAQIAQIPQQLAISTATMQAQANNPAFLAAQAYLGSQTQIAQQAQLSYTDSHYGGTTGPMDPLSNIIQAELNPNGYGGTPDPNAAFFNSIQTAPDSVCFPAGTRVLMADSSEQSIETLQIGESVRAHDGTKQVVTTILARIVPPPKRVYELSFDDGNTLTLTDSHPISTTEGWKSLSLARVQEEHPELAISTLQLGDRVHTVSGICTLVSIQPRAVVQVYNLTVDDPHTFYANGVLVHNKVMSSIMQQVADTTVPTTDLKNSNLIQSLASNFSSADLTHTFTASVNWAATGLEQAYTASVNWASQGLSQAYTAVVNWASQGLSQAYTATVNWAAQGLSQAYTAVASWTAQNLEKPLVATAEWAAQGLEHAFEGVVSWFASGGLQHTFEGAVNWVASGGLQHTFEGITDWIGQNLEHTFTGVASWIGQNLNANILAGGMTPGFASGVQNYSGGLAVVGERGPELVYLPQGASVYPHSAGFTPINSGSSNSGEMMMVNLTHITQLDGKTLAQETFPYIAPMIRQATGRRS